MRIALILFSILFSIPLLAQVVIDAGNGKTIVCPGKLVGVNVTPTRLDVRTTTGCKEEPPVPVDHCRASNAVVCRGTLDLRHNGERYNEPAAPGRKYVWEIPPQNRGSSVAFVMDYLSTPMTFSISTSPDGADAGQWCSVFTRTGNLYMNEKQVTYQCLVQPGVKYYLRVEAQKKGNYSIFW